MLFSNDPAIWLKDLLINAGLSYSISSLLSTAGLIIIVISLSWFSNLLAKVVIRKVVTKIVRKTTSQWDDIFLEQKVFTRLSHFAPALVIWFMAGWALKAYPVWLIAVHRLTYIYMLVVGAVVINSFIEAWHKIYLTLPISQHRHIKGYVQIVKLIVVVIIGLIIVSVVFSKQVTTIIAGLGVMASVIMLIFKDAILGLVASIQLSANNMVKVGDWITIPGREVDGEVSDITLTTVKVQNFDKTIVTVPVYSLVNESFQNWSGMQASGVRRIKRAFFIDMKSIMNSDKALHEKLSKISIIKDYFDQNTEGEKITILDKSTGKYQYFSSGEITNLGWFRLYAEAYLKNHAVIDKTQTIIVRHRAPEGNGLPLQVYAFTNKTDFVTYENVQSEIFEHLLARLGEFGLKVFQQPTGDDLLALKKQNE